jgi:hypothetical protein
MTDTDAAPVAELNEGQLADFVDSISDRILAIQGEIQRREAAARPLALQAAGGSERARSDLLALRESAALDRQELEDLRGAREDASALLVQKRSKRLAAESEEGRRLVEGVIAERIKAAAELDAATIALQDAYDRYLLLGREILTSPYCPLDMAGGMNAYEQARGQGRIMAAMPALLRDLFPTGLFPASGVSLAQSERAVWGQPLQGGR